MVARLVELRVRNLGVIDDVTVRLDGGMTALTGETGAGKTLLVGALSLLLGSRADATVVRSGADEAVVKGRFLRTEEGTDDLEVVVARSVVRAGRSKVWIDGHPASVAALGEVTGAFLELHGQHQHQSLVRTEAQRQVLDGYAHLDLRPLEQARRQLKGLLDESTALGGDVGQRSREVEFLRFQVDEIEAAAIEDGDEDRRLETEEDRLATASSHRQAAAEALALISGSEPPTALDQLAEASRSLGGRTPLAPLEARVKSVMADLGDLATELRSVVETWEDDPRRLDQIRQRRQLFHQLQRKYGNDLSDVVAFAAETRERLDLLALEERRAAALDEAVAAARSTLAACERDVAAARTRAAPLLAAEIESALHDLAMPSARFAITVEGEGAADHVTFLLGANPGEPLQPVAKAASGGELARTMLAIRLAGTDAPGVVVFDEVDAGVGGAAATSVGAALAGVGNRAQVLVVTHLAQVAAQADHQIEIRKTERDGRTTSEVVPLDGQARVIEVSRMLSGRPDSTSAQRHARELLDGGARPAT